MAPPKAKRPVTSKVNEPLVNGLAGELDHQPIAPPKQERKQSDGPLVDRYGHVLSEAVLTNWTSAARKALGVRRVNAALEFTGAAAQPDLQCTAPNRKETTCQQ